VLSSTSLKLFGILGLIGLSACTDDTPTQPTTNTAPPPAPSFDFARNTWTARAPMPGSDRRAVIAATVTNSAGRSTVYVFGGMDNSASSGGPVPGQAKSILAYDVSSNTWRTRNAQFIRSNTTAAVINGKVYIPGGFDFSSGEGFCCGSFRKTLWMYDPVADKMIRKADMPRSTAGNVAVALGGKLYVLAGDCGDCPTSDVRRLDRYDPATNTWRTLLAAPHRHQGGAGAAINGKFYVAGGSGGKVLDVFDPATNTWRTLAPAPVIMGMQAAVLNGRMHTPGIQGGDQDRRTYSYDPATNRWSATGRFPSNQNYRHYVQVNFQGRPHGLTVGGTLLNDTRKAAPSQLYTP
jgi:N-acetylneuraminic acid mutarotase